MKKVILPSVLLLALVFTSVSQAFAWGFWAHQRINRLAVFTLPPDMLVLYKKNIDYLTSHAVDPDKRRYAMDGEAPRHYIDIDHYGEYPFDNVPRDWDGALEKFSRDTLMAYGIVPWHIHRTYYNLVDAFKDGKLDRIMKISADLGHYISDSNVPLHTTENYNGQMTDQKGIHGLWESRLPELFGEDYDYFIGKAQYIEDVLDESWSSVLEAHICLDSVLGYERRLTETIGSDQKYSFENRGNSLIKTYSRPFSDAYHEMLSGQVERRIRASILRVGSIWYSAWVDAGQPDLKKFLQEELELEEQRKYDRKFKIEDREDGTIGAVTDPYEKVFGACCGHGMESCHGQALRSSEAEKHLDHAAGGQQQAQHSENSSLQNPLVRNFREQNTPGRNLEVQNSPSQGSSIQNDHSQNNHSTK